MFGRTLLILAALALAGCDRGAQTADKSAPGPQLDSPAPDAEPSTDLLALTSTVEAPDASTLATSAIN